MTAAIDDAFRMPRRALGEYPSNVTDDEWEFCAPYLTLMREDAPQREYPLRKIFDALRWFVRANCPWRQLPNDLPPWWVVQQQCQRWMQAGVFELMAQDLRVLLRELLHGRQAQPTAAILDSRTVQSTPESGTRAGYDGYKRRKGSKIHAAVDTLGHLLALRVTPANEQDRDQVGKLTAAVQEQTGQSVQIAYVDQGYTGDRPALAAKKCGIELCVVKLAEAKRGFVLLPKRWVVERSFAWASRFRRLGKDCERPSVTVAALAESQMVAGCWLRSGNTACVNGAAEFLRQTVEGLPAHVRVGLVRADARFGAASVFEAAERLGLSHIMAQRLTRPVQALCRHDDEAWQDTEVKDLQVQEVETDAVGRRLVVIRQRLDRRPEAEGKQLIEVPGYKFQALITNLPRSVAPLAVWRRYNGRADLENRIKELGDQFGIKRLTCESFWATEAVHHLAIAAYNLCALLQRRLGQLEHCQLQTLRWRLFTRAAVWSRSQGKPSLRLAVRGEAQRHWWREILAKLTAPPNCNAVGSLCA